MINNIDNILGVKEEHAKNEQQQLQEQQLSRPSRPKQTPINLPRCPN